MNILKPNESKKVGAISSIVLWLIMILSCQKEQKPFSWKHYNYHQDDTSIVIPSITQDHQDEGKEKQQSHHIQPDSNIPSKQIKNNTKAKPLTANQSKDFETYLQHNTFPSILIDSAFGAQNKEGIKTVYRNYMLVKKNEEKMKDFMIVKNIIDSSDLSAGIKRLAPYIPRQENSYNNGWEENDVQARWLRQFIPSRAKEYNLSTDSTNDDRINVKKSTEAAIHSIIDDYNEIKNNDFYKDIINKYNITDDIFLDLATINAHNTGVNNITLFLKNCLENKEIQDDIKEIDKNIPWRLFIYMTQWYGLEPAYKDIKKKRSDTEKINPDFISNKKESPENSRYIEDNRRYWQESAEYVRHIIKYYIIDNTDLPNQEEDFFALLDQVTPTDKLPYDFIEGQEISYHSPWKTAWISISVLIAILWLGIGYGIQRRKYQWVKEADRKHEIIEILKEWFYYGPKEWWQHMTEEIKKVWNNLTVNHKKVVMATCFILLFSLWYHIIKDKKNNTLEYQDKTSKFPKRESSMWLDHFTVYESWQTHYTNPYLYDHRKDVIRAHDATDFEEEKSYFIKLSQNTVYKYFYAKWIGNKQTEVEDWSKDNIENNNREYAYLHNKTRNLMVDLHKEFNKRLKEAWYKKTLTLQINSLSRACNAQSIAWNNKTESLSAHEVGIAVDFLGRNEKNWDGKSDKFVLFFDDNGTRKEVESSEVKIKANLILNKLLEERRREGKLFITPETAWAIHIVFGVLWKISTERDISGRQIPHIHKK